MTYEITIPADTQEQAASAQNLLARARAFEVTGPVSYQAAADELQTVKARFKELDESEKSLTRPINDGLKRIRDFFRAPKQFLVDAESHLKRAMITYQQAEEEKRREAERKAQEIARRETEKLRLRAEAAAAKGKAEKAEALEAKADAVPMPIIPRSAPSAAGVSMRDNWKGEVTDFAALVRAVADGLAPITLLEANTKVIGQLAKAQKDTVKYPGIRFYNDPTIASRSAL